MTSARKNLSGRGRRPRDGRIIWGFTAIPLLLLLLLLLVLLLAITEHEAHVRRLYFVLLFSVCLLLMRDKRRRSRMRSPFAIPPSSLVDSSHRCRRRSRWRSLLCKSTGSVAVDPFPFLPSPRFRLLYPRGHRRRRRQGEGEEEAKDKVERFSHAMDRRTDRLVFARLFARRRKERRRRRRRRRRPTCNS